MIGPIARANADTVHSPSPPRADADDRGQGSACNPKKGTTHTLLAHALDLMLARSCLAALADGAPTLDASSAYEQVLITLDWIHADDVSTLQTDGLTDDRGALFELAFSTIEELGSHRVDELHVELLLAMLTDARYRELA